jgi:hypothetical protein
MCEAFWIEIIETGFEGTEDDLPAGCKLIYPTIG